MSGKCVLCNMWTRCEDKGWFGACRHPSVGKRAGRHGSEADELVIEGVRSEARVYFGESFGCIHWQPQQGIARESGTAGTLVTPVILRGLMHRHKMKPVDLARRLHVRVQRVSDWLSGRRKVPELAVVAMSSMNLLSPFDLS